MNFYALPPAETRLPFRALARALAPLASDFAQDLRRYLDVDLCILASSGRSLLYLLFETLRRQSKKGDGEILLPGYTCYSLAAAAVKAGCKVAVYDLDPHTLQADLADVEKKISSRTVAVVGQHLLGVQEDIGSLARLAHEHGIVCVEDSAQSLSGPIPISVAGQAADYTVFSFGRGKPLPLGSGGALVAGKTQASASPAFDLDTLPDKTPNFLLPFAIQILARPRFYWFMEKLPLGLGRTVYDPGFRVAAMSNFYQRIGSASLFALPRCNQHRTRTAYIYHALLANQGGGDVAAMPPLIRYPFLVRNQQEGVPLALFGVRQFYPRALCDLPALGTSLAAADGQTPGAREIAGRLLTLPTHLAVSEKIARHIAAQVCDTFHEIDTITFAGKALTAGAESWGEQVYG